MFKTMDSRVRGNDEAEFTEGSAGNEGYVPQPFPLPRQCACAHSLLAVPTRSQVTMKESISFVSELVAGDCFYASADVPHGVRAIEAGTLIDVFTPIREDLLGP